MVNAHLLADRRPEPPRLEKSCLGTVSCTDMLALAARDSINLTGSNVIYQVPADRHDERL
jgi:hypothetical protein